MPLYFFSMMLLVLIVGYLSDWKLREPALTFIQHITQWLGFSIVDAPNINKLEQTFVIVAGVTWSLAYEWLFYLSLPLLALLLSFKSNSKPAGRYLVLSVVGVIFILMYQPLVPSLKAFLTGMIAAHLVEFNKIQRISQTHIGSSFVVVFIIAAVIYSPSPYYGNVPMVLLSMAFILIASGNTLFGLLTLPLSRAFGEMAYSLYLLHGILLFFVLEIVIGTTKLKVFSVAEHWTLIIFLCPILVIVCRTTFKLIEYPSMQSTDKLLSWIKVKLS